MSQARATFDSEEITALAEDIQEHGLNHPVTVREGPGGRYQLVAGERRWLAAKQAGLTNILARVRCLDDFTAHLVGVSENNRRSDLSAWEMSLEAARLLQHAKECDRPHTQRDLARYLNRNVSLVNYQLAIAAAITPHLLAAAQVGEQDVCRLPHVTLRRVANLPEAQRPRALKEAIRMMHGCKGAATAENRQSSALTPKTPAGPPDWQRLWESGGFHVRLRQPLRDLGPRQAEKYAHEIAPVLIGLAARASSDREEGAVIQWESALGRLVYVQAPERMSAAARVCAQEALQELLDAVAARNDPEAP